MSNLNPTYPFEMSCPICGHRDAYIPLRWDPRMKMWTNDGVDHCSCGICDTTFDVVIYANDHSAIPSVIEIDIHTPDTGK
jgi:transcription elongation factor Elf1